MEEDKNSRNTVEGGKNSMNTVEGGKNNVSKGAMEIEDNSKPPSKYLVPPQRSSSKKLSTAHVLETKIAELDASNLYVTS